MNLFNVFGSIKNLIMGSFAVIGATIVFFLKQKNNSLKENLKDTKEKVKIREDQLKEEKANQEVIKKETEQKVKIKDFELQNEKNNTNILKKEKEVTQAVKKQINDTKDGEDYEINL